MERELEGETLSSRGAYVGGSRGRSLQEKGSVAMRTKTVFYMLAAVTLLAAGGGAETVGYSVETALDTRSLSQATAVEDKALDSRSYTEKWSAAGRLNTKRIMGTMIMVY